MGGIQAIDKLRKAADGDSPFWCSMVRMFTEGDGMSASEDQSRNAALALADEIESEIRNRYMLLPVDADGVPVHFGDRLKNEARGGVSSEGNIVKMEYCYGPLGKDPKWIVDFGGWVDPKTCTHAEPRSLEDVLQDMLENAGAYDGNFISAYAYEIRELLGVSE